MRGILVVTYNLKRNLHPRSDLKKQLDYGPPKKGLVFQGRKSKYCSLEQDDWSI